jgi:hypothetical protein
MADDHDDDDDGYGNDQVLKREKQNRLKTTVYLIGPFCFAIQDTMWV